MIIDHLCTSLGGGASVAAQRLHSSLQSRGLDSRFWYSGRESRIPKIASARPIVWPRDHSVIAESAERINRIARRLAWQWQKIKHLRSRPSGFELFSPARMPATTRYDATVFAGDVLNLHWVSKLIDFPTFFQSIPSSLPVVWTLHDMNPFTGGCHFAAGCDRFAQSCGNCGQIARWSERDLSHRQLRVKREALQKVKLHVAAPSRWLLDAARCSAVFSNALSFRLIPYGIDTVQFCPRDKAAARQSLRIPAGCSVIGFGADAIGNRRKGWAEMVAALKKVKVADQLVALVFGAGSISDCELPALKVMPVGFVSDARRLANIYSAMDFFVLPSLEDNLPQTGLEAMSCGTPVVAFDAGGIPDFVSHGHTGLLARTADCNELADQIERLANDSELVDSMSRSARKLIVEQFNSELEAARYEAFYRELLAEHRECSEREAA